MMLAGVGGILGAITRYLLGKWISEKNNSAFPFSTWIINLSGSFFLGFLANLHFNGLLPAWSWLLIGTGFLGAYTTFSTFGYEVIQMLQKDQRKNILIYIVSSIGLGILFAWIGGFAAGKLG
ncbi:MAG TPA: fluoride efflux transporter CrcB [Chondromyces sp.]|nr:fluoride efflux transporter CrcB [Chondromyces sp.]